MIEFFLLIFQIFSGIYLLGVLISLGFWLWLYLTKPGWTAEEVIQNIGIAFTWPFWAWAFYNVYMK